MKCPITGCPISKIIIGTFAAFATIFVFDWIYHGHFMMADYQASAHLWRSPETMQDYFSYITLSQLLRAFTLSALFCWLYSKCTASDCKFFSIKFGLVVGILVGSCSLGSYAYMPVPLIIPLKWFIGEIMLAIVVAAVLSIVSKFGGSSGCCDSKSSCSEKGNA